MNRFLLLLCLLTGTVATAQVNWPKHRKAAIVLTYDDGLRSQLDIAVPQLKKAGLNATFFLTSDVDSARLPKWRAVSRSGSELGNHTVFHPCAGLVDNPVSSDLYTVHQLLREIEVMGRFLYVLDGKYSRTFAYPCAETSVGGHDYVDSLRKFPLIKYARVGGDTDAVITNPLQLDPLRVPSYGLDGGETGAQLIEFVKKVQQSGGMGVLMFHGVGGDYITVSAEAHQQLLDYLKANKRTIWVATFKQAMDQVTEQVGRGKVQVAR